MEIYCIMICLLCLACIVRRLEVSSSNGCLPIIDIVQAGSACEARDMFVTIFTVKTYVCGHC